MLIDLSITEEPTSQTQLITVVLQCHLFPFLKANLVPRTLYKPLDLMDPWAIYHKPTPTQTSVAAHGNYRTSLSRISTRRDEAVRLQLYLRSMSFFFVMLIIVFVISHNSFSGQPCRSCTFFFCTSEMYLPKDHFTHHIQTNVRVVFLVIKETNPVWCQFVGNLFFSLVKDSILYYKKITIHCFWTVLWRLW